MLSRHREQEMIVPGRWKNGRVQVAFCPVLVVCYGRSIGDVCKGAEVGWGGRVRAAKVGKHQVKTVYCRV